MDTRCGSHREGHLKVSDVLKHTELNNMWKG